MARSSALDRIRMQAYGASSDKLSAYERINARNTGVGGYSYYTIDKWQKDHDNSYATINDYYSRIGNGDWLSSDDRAAYKSAIDTYTSTGTALRNLRSKLNNSYSPEAEEDWLNWQKSSTSLGSHFADVDAFYGQFADDVAYNNWKMGVTPEEQQKWYQGWFKNGAFSDGYQFGDVTKSLINTAFHVGENATQAAVDATENLIDTHAYAVGAVGGLFNKDFQGKVGDFIGKDLLRTEKTGRAIHNVVSLGASAAFGGAEENSFLGTKSEGLVQSASHMAGSMLLQKVGVPTMATIGVNAFGSEIESAFAQGAGYGEAGISGAVSAGAEILFEKLFGGFKVMKGNSVSDGAIKWVSDKIGNSFLRVLAKGGMSATFEGFEELATEFTNAAVKKMTYLNDKEFNEIMNFDTAMDAFVGGVIMGSGGNAIQTGAGLASVGRQDVSPLVNAGLEIDPNNRAMQTYQTKLDAGQRINAFDRYEAQNAAVETLRDYDSKQIGGATRDRLNQLGETGNIDRVADALTKRTIGEDLSLRDKAAIRQSQYGERVGNELDRKNIESGMYSSRWAEGIGTKMVNADVYNRRETSADRPVEVDATKASRSSLKDDIRSVKVDDGRARITLSDGREVGIDEMQFRNEREELVVRAATDKVEKIKGFSNEAATAMIKGYDGRVNPSDYNNAINDAYRYGYQGIPQREISTGKYTSLVADKSALYVAYDAGKQFAKTSFTRPNFLDTKADSVKGAVMFDKSVDQSKLSKSQKTQIKALDIIASGLGININVFDSPTNSEGQHIGENGRYNIATRSIDIDLHAGANGDGIMLNTASHEITHHIKEVASDKFKAFADAVFEEFGNSGVSVDELIETRLNRMREGGMLKNLSETEAYDLAYEEVVADAAETMLTDSDALLRLSERVKERDRGLWDKVKDFIGNMVSKVQAIYKKVNPDSLEGMLVRDMGKSAERLQKLWVEGVMAASDMRYDNSKTVENPIETISRDNSIVEDVIEIDTKSKSVVPTMFSERTWTASEYVTKKRESAKKIASALNVSINRATKYIDDINSIAKMIADDRSRLDYEASLYGSAFVSNAEYGGSFDYTTLCPKRRLYTGTFSEIQKKLENTALTPDDILKIRNLMIDEGVEATCGLCYVEGSRANMGKFSKQFIELYKRDNPNGWIPNMADVNTPDGVEKMRINHPEVYEKYEYFWNHYGKLKESDPALFASQQKPKLYESRKEYKGEILTHFKSDKSIENKNRNGGIRMQSFSDFELVHMIDTMQVIMDMSSVGLAGQAYTKVPEFARAFGNTGLKINLSLIAKDVDANGKLVFDDREGMPNKTAFDLRNKYSKNVGTILVTFTDEQLKAAMADDRIDFIIPFHRSQWKKGQYGAMGLPKGTKDYTYMQNEKLIKQTYHEYQGRMVKDKASNYMPNEYWDFSKSGKENAENYLEMCAKNNKRPKFYKLLDYDGNGKYSLKADGSTDGYWKLLIDFKMYDNEGIGSPQHPVRPEFNMGEAKTMLDEYAGGHGQYPIAHNVVDKFVNEYNGNVKYSSRLSPEESFSKRTLLANALESVAQNEGEAKRLKEYKANIEGLNEQEKKLWDLKRQMKELSFGKGTKDMAEIKKVREEITKTENRINLYDKKLLDLESTSALKAVMEREKKNAYRAAAEKGREALHKNVVGRQRTAEIHSIQKIAKELDGLLNRGTKEKNVKKGGADFVRSALDLSNMLFASDDDLLLSGIETEYTDSEAKAMDDYMRLYEEYHSYDNAVTENKARRAELRSQMTDVKHGFSDALERERKRISNAKASDTFDALIKEYKNLQNSSESYIRETFDKDKLGHIEALKEKVGNTTLKDMSLEQLKDVHKAFTITKTMVQNSNKLFVEGKKASVKDQGEQAIHELELKGHKKTFTTPGKKASTFGYNNLKPIYLMERTGSAVLQEQFQNVMRGEDTYATDIYDAERFFEGEKGKHGYNKWDFKKTKTFDTGTGLKYDLTLGQMMSIYAYSKRGEQAMEHLRTDGFVYDGAKKVKGKGGITYELNDKTAYKISDKVFLEIVNSLTKEQKAFVDATQKYLSDVMGAKGNEVSEKLVGIDLFGEENYFPIRSERAYLERAREQASGEIKIKNKGFTKQTQKGARNAIVLSDYNKIWGEHVSEMSMYHAFTLPLEDFYRVYNYQTTSSLDADKKGVIPALSNAYGEGMTQAIDRLLSDLNGGARSESLEAEAKKLISLHKKAKTMASLSVIVQQPSSIIRAQAMVDPKYFVGQKVSKGGHKAKWEEIKTYAPVAIIKEMGHFDVGMGRSSADWIVGEKTVSDHINEVLSKPASYADEVGWISIWDAVKRETARSNPKMNTSSEDFLKKAGERFEDVIRHTQVYDSTLSKSANMRSKSAFMQMLTSFMAEPTTSINMREMALRSGDAKRIARTTAAVYASTLLNSVLVALPYAFRDDDEDETFAEKYAAALSTSFVDNINPINSIPILKDVWSLGKGYSVERADMSLAEDVLNSFKGVIKSATAEERDTSTVVNSVIELVGDLSSFLGIPVDNIYRDVKSYINFGKTISREQNGMETTWNSISDALEGAMRKNTPVVGWFGGESKGKRLYDAILAEDDAYVSRFRAEYEEEYADIIDETIRETKIENAYNSAVRKALRDNDPRVEEAALAKLSGDENKYEDLMNEVIEEGIFDAELVEVAFDAEYNYHEDKKKDAELRGKTYP